MQFLRRMTTKENHFHKLSFLKIVLTYFDLISPPPSATPPVPGYYNNLVIRQKVVLFKETDQEDAQWAEVLGHQSDDMSALQSPWWKK